jgi:selenocysteine-specific elongation factor
VTPTIAGGELVEAADGLTLPGRVVALPPSLAAVVDRFLKSLAAGVFAPPTDDLPEPAVLAYLAERGLVTDTGLGIVYDPAVYKEVERRVVAYLDEHGSISLAEMRDLFGTSRKYAQPTLEYMDALKITRRVGESRVLLRRPAQDANDDGG